MIIFSAVGGAPRSQNPFEHQQMRSDRCLPAAKKAMYIVKTQQGAVIKPGLENLTH